MNDSEIAKKANRCNVTIYNWRKRNNLAPNGWQKLTAKELQDIREMYYKGLNDCEIAKKINRSQETICRWRKKNNLIPNGLNRITAEQFQDIHEMYLAGFNDYEIGETIGTNKSNIRHWRKVNKLPANAPKGWQHPQIDESNIQPEDKPWNDPESLFCDAEFLEQITGKQVRRIENAN